MAGSGGDGRLEIGIAKQAVGSFGDTICLNRVGRRLSVRYFERP